MPLGRAAAMPNWIALPLTLLLLADADLPRVDRLRPVAQPAETFPAGETISVFPDALSPDQQAQVQAQNKPRAAKLQEESKLALIRYVSGEFARAVKPLPAGKEGFLIAVDKPLNQQGLDSAVATHGAAVNTGDNVQITRLEFRDHAIVVDVNGGGRGKKSWRDRIQISMGGGMPTMRTTQQDAGPPGLQPGMGSTVFLEFSKPVPDLTPEDLKKLLSPVLDFSKQRSASVQWFDTLPPDIKKAITERHPVVGMDREMVVAAMGKPDHKVRERDSNGNDIEDWIYGQPPDKTVFVRFTGERVTNIKQFPQ